MRKSVVTKVIIFGVLLLFIDTSVFSSIDCSTAESEEKSSIASVLDNCYGIVIPMLHGENIPSTSIQQGISNMINDLLRMEIPVFWASSNFSSLTRTLLNDVTQIRYFEQGTFIVPFTENYSTNALIISIATDYELGSEIETYYPVTMFFIMEPLYLDVYPLQYAKCALRFGLNCGYVDVYMYLDILYSSGFLETQLLFDDEIDQKLNNNDFNLLIWPGGATDVGVTSFFEDVNVNDSRSIRNFVNNGGGYVSSCYGAYAASSGLILPLFLPFVHHRNLTTIGFLALTSSSVLILNCQARVTVTLVNRSHPVSFGLNPTQESWHGYGPIFPWITMDHNTQVIGILDDLQVNSWRIPMLYEKIPPQLLEKYLNFVKGKPIWISSQFGQGKIVIFGCHPEFQNPNRQDRVIDNAILYVTSGKKTTRQFTSSVLFSKLIALTVLTSDINLSNHRPIFTELWETIQLLNTTCKTIDDALTHILLHCYRINEERYNEYTKLDQGIIPLKEHDSYQQWLGVFLKALIKLERVYSLIQNTANISARISHWRNQTNSDIFSLEDYCMRLNDKLTVLQRTMEHYVGSPYERTQLLALITAVELLYRQGHEFLNQLWSSTVKTYRDSWYTYESMKFIEILPGSDTSVNSLVDSNTPSYRTNHQGNNHIFHVDDDTIFGGDGSIKHPYPHIQDAIDASCDGDTIYVHEGIYYEHLSISKSIKLIGENTNTTIIDGEYRLNNLIAIFAPHVELTNFTIQNSEKLRCGVVVYSSNNTIRGNIIKNNGWGLGFYENSLNNLIIENQFIGNILGGTGLNDVAQRNNCFERNTFRENKIGLYVIDTDTIIRDNMFFDDGLLLFSYGPIVTEIVNNTVNGKPLICYKNLKNFHITNAGEIILSNCTEGIIDHIVINNTDSGIYVISSSNIQIVNCTFASNHFGIMLIGSTNINIHHNMILNNKWVGIWLLASNNIQILKTSVSNNTDGIYLYQSSFNRIKNNYIVSNILGLSCWFSCNDNEVYENNFLNNHENAFDTSQNQWDSNYWDDWIGIQSNVFRFLPYRIPGTFFSNLDRHPTPKPSEISRMI